MKKKGFTLVELLGVLVVLSVILMITFPLISSYIDKSKQKSYDAQMELIITSLKDYAIEHKEVLPVNSNDYVTFTLGQLKSLGLVNNSVVNPKDGKEIDDSMEFRIIKEGTRYVYQIVENTILSREDKNHTPTITLNGNVLEYVELNGIYEEKGASAVDYDGNALSLSTNSNNIDLSTSGVYQVKYEAVDSLGTKTYAIRTIIVSSNVDANFRIYYNGEIVYFNPNTNKKCTESEANSNINKTSGCMKWYAFLDIGSSSIKLILDHNTSGTVAWNTNYRLSTPDTANAQLVVDTSSWNAAVKSTVRLISAVEINQIAPSISSWNISDYNTHYNLHNGNKNSYQGALGTNKYGWLFDNTNGCAAYGCNKESGEVKGYWTSSPTANANAWAIRCTGFLIEGAADEAYTNGVRPVIEIQKNIIK